jgi:secreted protein with Ig-like and vWFA domain
MPVLGTLFARRDKSVMDEQRELNGRDGRDQGKTTVAGGAPSVTGSARFDGKHAGSRENNAVAKADKSDQSVSDRARGEVLSQVEEGWGKASLADGKSKDTDAKLKLEYSSDYNFKEKDLGQSKEASASKAQAPQLEIIRELTYPTEYEPPEPPQGNHPSAASAALSKAIQDQENKVEERRKVLATIARTKQAILKDSTQTMMDSTRDSAIKRGLDAQDYGDAQRDFETDHKLLQQMKLKQLETVMSADPGELRKAVKDQESKVEERRKALATIVRTKGIIYKGADSFYDRSGGDEDQGAHDALQTYQKLTQEKMQLEAQINSLLKYDSDQLMVYAGGLDLPDNVVKDVYPKYQEAKRQLEDLKIQGLADAHPAVLAAKDQINTKKRQIDEGVVNLRATLKAQLELADNRLKSVEGMKDSTREEAIKRGLDAQDYVDAKRDFEADQMLLQQMKLKLLEKTDAPLPEPEQPKPDLTKLMEETVATQDPYSTFSLYISDASFQVAQAAFAKGERPDPAGIKVEQFYNAVDYGDPSPTAGEPVAVAIEQAAHPVIPGRNLVRVALKTAAAGRSAAQALRLTLLVDQSGSMVRDDRRAAMDKALAGLAGLLTKNDLVTVVGFARTPRLLADGWTGEQAAKLTELVNQSASEGGTNLEEALKLAEQLAERRKLAGAQNRIVLFTDGAANLGDADPARLAAKVKALRQKGIAFDIAGIAADDLNDELLGELARNGNGRYYVVGKGADENFAHQLAGAFRPAAENVKVQVHFNPERVGRYKLIGFEKDRLKTEDFRNDAVDAAELAAEEAGVAIYQVEPLPGGSGELGDVSVRFRDTASGQMVERTWTIPHDAGAPTLDRATPPMQLAVLALFAAEKLRGGPLAEAIDFKQLAEPRANVKRFYGNTGRVAEVLHMIDSL